MVSPFFVLTNYPQIPFELYLHLYCILDTFVRNIITSWHDICATGNESWFHNHVNNIGRNFYNFCVCQTILNVLYHKCKKRRLCIFCQFVQINEVQCFLTPTLSSYPSFSSTAGHSIKLCRSWRLISLSPQNDFYSFIQHLKFEWQHGIRNKRITKSKNALRGKLKIPK